MFMLMMLLCVSINLRSDVTMMNGMMLLFLDLTIQILFHLQLKMKMVMNQVSMKVIMLKLTMVSKLIGSVKLASVMLLRCLLATLVLVGTCHD